MVWDKLSLIWQGVAEKVKSRLELIEKEPEESLSYCECGSLQICNVYDFCPDCNNKRIINE